MGNSSAAEVRVAGPQRRAPLPPPALRCAYGAETIMVRSQEELLTRAKRDYDSAVATKLAANMPRGVAGQARKQRRRNPQLAAAEPLGVEPGHSHAQLRRLAEDGSVDRMVAYDGASGSLVPLSQLLGASLRRDTAGGRVLFTPTSQAAGVRTFLPLRTRWTNSADSAAMSQVSLANSLANLARMFSTQSYGAMTPAFANNTACVYPLLTVNSTNNNDYSKFYNEAVVVARNHSDPACRYEPSAFSHVMIIHQNAPVGYGGLGACPGSSTWYNGITAEWMLMHELGHNFGLPHGFTYNVASRTSDEYADATEPMGSARETWAGLSYEMGFRDGMNWIANSQQWDATASRAERTVRLNVASAERVGGAAGLVAAGLPNAVVTLRVPTNDGIPNTWLYGGWRAQYNRAVITGLQLHHTPLDFNPLSSPVTSTGNALGPPTLWDIVPSTLDQMDAEIPPGGAYVYGDDDGVSPRTLIEAFPVVRVPASSVDPADDVLPVSVTALTPANERPEGRGCVPGTSACQQTVVEATRWASCNANASAVLTQVAPVAIFRLELPPGSPGDATAVLAHTCASLPVATHLGVFSDWPAAQALARAHVGSGALTFAEQRFSVNGASLGAPSAAWTGAVTSQACGEVSFPLTAAGPLYLVVALASPSALLTSPASAVPVNLSVTCAPQVANLRSWLRQDTTIFGADWQGVFQHHASSGATGIVNQRRQFIKPASPWFSVNKIEFNAEWKWCSASYRGYSSCNVARGEPAPAGTFEVTNITVLDSTALSLRYACPPNMYAPTAATVTSCAACPAGTVSVAGAVGLGACICDKGWGFSAATGACALCAAGTYKGTAGDSACVACSTGATSSPGAVNSMACKTVWCERLQISGHNDGRVNGAFVNGGSYNGQPFYRKEGAATIIFRNGWSGGWSFTDDTSKWPTFSFYFGSGFDMNARVTGVPPQFWRTADWGTSLTAGRNMTTACTCVAPKTLNSGTGACITPAPAPTGALSCAIGTVWTGTACAACPPYQIAAPNGSAVCVCPRGYTSPGATFACEPPRVLNISVVTPGASVAVVAGIAGTYALIGSVTAPALRVNASEPYVPAYARVGPATGLPGAPYLVGHASRGEWSLKPELSSSHSPRFGFWGDFAGGQTNATGGAGAFPPLAPSVATLTDTSALSGLDSAAWAVPFSIFDGATLTFSASLALALQPMDMASPSTTPSATPSPASLSVTPTGTASLSPTRTGTRTNTPTASPTPTASASCAGAQCACTAYLCDFRIRQAPASGGYWAWDATSDTIRLQAASASGTVFRMLPGVVCGVTPLSTWDRLAVTATGKAVNHANFNLHASAWAVDACPSTWLDVAWRVEMVGGSRSAFRLLNPYNSGVYATLSADGYVAITSTPDTSLQWYLEWVTVPSPSVTASPSSSGTATATLSGSVTPPLTGTPSTSASGTSTATTSATVSGTGSVTPSLSGTPPGTPSRSVTPSLTPSRSGSSSLTSGSDSRTPSLSPTRSRTGTSTATASGTVTESATLTSTASPTLSPTGTGSASATETASRTSSVTPSTSSSGTATASTTLSGSTTATRTGSATATVTATVTGSITGTASLTGSTTGTATTTGSVTKSATKTGSTTATRSVAPSLSGTPRATPSITVTGTATLSATGTGSRTATLTATGTGSVTGSGTSTPTTTASGTGSTSNSPSSSATNSASVSGSATRSQSGTKTITSSLTGTRSTSISPTPSRSTTSTSTGTLTPSGTGTTSPSQTRTGTGSGTSTPTGTTTPSGSVTGTPTGSVTPSGTGTETPSGTAASTGTGSATGSKSRAPSGTATKTLMGSRTASGTRTLSPSRSRWQVGTSRTPSLTASRTRTPSITRKRKV